MSQKYLSMKPNYFVPGMLKIDYLKTEDYHLIRNLKN